MFVKVGDLKERRADLCSEKWISDALWMENHTKLEEIGKA